MPSEIFAAVAHAGEFELRVERVQLRDPGEADVVVEVAASAFCYSDWLSIDGDAERRVPGIHPIVLGHSAVGTVVERGTEGRHRIGQRVLITATPECGVCFWCTTGRVDQCEGLFVPAPVVGTLADGSELRAPGHSGTYAERTVIRAMQVFPIDSPLPDTWLAMFGCGIVSGMGAVVNVGRVEPRDTVVVVGCGQIGLWMIQAARARGAARIVAVEPLAHRRELATRVGATDVIDPADGPVDEAVRALTHGRGADLGFDAGGTFDAVRDAFLATRNGGVTVLTSYVERWSQIELPLFDLALRGRDVRSSQSGRLDMRRDIAQFTTMLESGAIDVDAMLGGTYALQDINGALAASRDRTEITPIVRPGAQSSR
jgi:S-(hydroxymethyl)glutathione dehydrogenase/alcohol dehydrogenase